MAPMRGSLKGNVSMCPLWSPNYTFNCVLDKGASSGGGAGKIRNEELGIRNEGGGARIGKRRLMISLRKSTFIGTVKYLV